MDDAAYVRSRAALLRPRAKFVRHAHSQDFVEATSGANRDFHYVSIYDERIDSNVHRTPRGLIILNNSYLSSFAHNLFLCWSLRADTTGRVPPGGELDRLLRHNFKKFFAEQLLHANGNVFSRAVFLETLLFEQAIMVPVFADRAGHPELNRNANLGAQVMSSAVAFHELAHVYLDDGAETWEEALREDGDLLAELFAEVVASHRPGFVLEFQCDALAVLCLWRQYGTEMGPTQCLRAIVFAFAAFTVLFSLARSATLTAAAHGRLDEQIDLTSIEKREADYEYKIGIDRELDARARLVSRLCERIARSHDCALFGGGDAVPLPHDVHDLLLRYVDRVMESDDANARSMSLLVAEALKGHPRGTEYLYLRSKTFESLGGGADPLTDEDLQGRGAA